MCYYSRIFHGAMDYCKHWFREFRRNKIAFFSCALSHFYLLGLAPDSEVCLKELVRWVVAIMFRIMNTACHPVQHRVQVVHLFRMQVCPKNMCSGHQGLFEAMTRRKSKRSKTDFDDFLRKKEI